MIPNLVLNLSSCSFTEEELNFLNKGLKFAVKPRSAPLEEIISNIEAGIQYRTHNSRRNAIRYDVEQCILKVAGSKITTKNNMSKGNNNIIESLRTKNVIYTKADKGNAIVIMDRDDYDNKITQMLTEGPYEEVKFQNGNPKNPLNKMTEEASGCAKEVSQLMSDPSLRFRLHVSNPRVAHLYCLPKIHKNPLAMRPIASNINTPLEKQAKWLLDLLEKYPIKFGNSVLNSVELVQKLKDVKVKRGEKLVSFDVQSLFPNVPADVAIDCMKKHLTKEGASPEEVKASVIIAKAVMAQNFFQFRGRYYKQNHGLSMGSKLSPYLANIFMCFLEEKLKKNALFPRVWYRYVDDVIAIIRIRQLQSVLRLINEQYETIKFTVEEESNNCLPFLDLLISKTDDGDLEFSIYRKPTHTDRYITSDSFHCGAHKQAAFHAMAHRLHSIPMNASAHQNEENYIYEVGAKNGYSRSWIKKILERHSKKKERELHSTLEPIRPEPTRRISVPYYPRLTNELRGVLEKHGIELVTCTSSTLKTSLCNYKDKEPKMHSSGIYSVGCKNCDLIYIGQSRRRIETRIQEHIRHTNNRNYDKSGVAEHMIECDHNIDNNSIKVVKVVRREQLLDAWESLTIATHDSASLMNREDAPISSPLFDLSSLILE